MGNNDPNKFPTPIKRKKKKKKGRKKEIRRERKDLDLGKKREDILADLDKLCGAGDANA